MIRVGKGVRVFKVISCFGLLGIDGFLGFGICSIKIGIVLGKLG